MLRKVAGALHHAEQHAQAVAQHGHAPLVGGHAQVVLEELVEALHLGGIDVSVGLGDLGGQADQGGGNSAASCGGSSWSMDCCHSTA